MCAPQPPTAFGDDADPGYRLPACRPGRGIYPVLRHFTRASRARLATRAIVHLNAWGVNPAPNRMFPTARGYQCRIDTFSRIGYNDGATKHQVRFQENRSTPGAVPVCANAAARPWEGYLFKLVQWRCPAPAEFDLPGMRRPGIARKREKTQFALAMTLSGTAGFGRKARHLSSQREGRLSHGSSDGKL